MIYPDTNPDEWSERYHINKSSVPCDRCGKTLIPEIPFAYEDWRGLRSKPHPCGKIYDLVVAVSVDKQSRERWTDLYNSLQAEEPKP